MRCYAPFAFVTGRNRSYLVCDLQLLSLCLCLHFFLPVWPLMCAGLLQRLKCLTQSLINQNRLRRLAQTPRFHLSHRAASLALKGEAKGSRLLCVVFISIFILAPVQQCRLFHHSRSLNLWDLFDCVCVCVGYFSLILLTFAPTSGGGHTEPD